MEEEQKEESYIRYARLAAIPEIGKDGVDRLRDGNVLVIGCGALGSLCAMYLVASGVGSITIADFDTVDLSNLQRQLFFSEADMGVSKAKVLAGRMRALNSRANVTVMEKMLRRQDALSIFADYDVIIDGSDNPDTKRMTDEVSAETGVPCVIAGVREFECQVMTCVPNGTRYADVFGSQTMCSGFTPCSAGGVLGPVAGVAASIQASEAIKLLTRTGETLKDRIITVNLLDMDVKVIPVG